MKKCIVIANFRYFMPSSGGPAASTETYESVIKNSGHEWDDFFIFAASGTNDFAYSGYYAMLYFYNGLRWEWN